MTYSHYVNSITGLLLAEYSTQNLGQYYVVDEVWGLRLWALLHLWQYPGSFDIVVLTCPPSTSLEAPGNS